MGRDRNEEVGTAAYHIDKFCTGGDENDWKAAEAIVAELVDPVAAERDRLREALAGVVAARDDGEFDAAVEIARSAL